MSSLLAHVTAPESAAFVWMFLLGLGSGIVVGAGIAWKARNWFRRN